jgi:hypothetical protein
MRQRATDKPVRAVGTRVERAFLLVATMCVVLMPSTYRGGAEIPHPHGLFQFWLTGADRAFDHHRHDHGAHDHTAHMSAGTEHSADDATSTDSSEVSSSAATDEPRVSPATAPGGMISAITIVVMVLVGLSGAAATRWRYPSWSSLLVGRMLSPEPPPPRHSAVAH